jgi:hypothetical protein
MNFKVQIPPHLCPLPSWGEGLAGVLSFVIPLSFEL